MSHGSPISVMLAQHYTNIGKMYQATLVQSVLLLNLTIFFTRRHIYIKSKSAQTKMKCYLFTNEKNSLSLAG